MGVSSVGDGKRNRLNDLQDRIDAALDTAFHYGQTDGAHHKAWVIDQMVAALMGPDYQRWVEDYRDGEDGPNTYEWDEGIAP